MNLSKEHQTRGKNEKKPKKKTKTQLNSKADKEWALAVKERAGNRCEYCGRIDTLNSHHIFSRSNHSVRWDIDNGACLCVSHHTFNHDFSAHKAPAEFLEWIKNVRGLEWYERLREKARKSIKEV